MNKFQGENGEDTKGRGRYLCQLLLRALFFQAFIHTPLIVTTFTETLKSLFPVVLGISSETCVGELGFEIGIKEANLATQGYVEEICQGLFFME